MLEHHLPITLITVTQPSDACFLERFPSMLRHFTSTFTFQIAKHIVILDSPFRTFATKVSKHFVFPWRVEIFQEPSTRGDLFAINDAFSLVKTEVFIVVSPKTRLFTYDWIESFRQALAVPNVALVGKMHNGSAQTENQMRNVLDKRHLTLDHPEYIQTWCFGMSTAVFREVGGFWEPGPPWSASQEDLFAAQIYLSVSTRAREYEIAEVDCPLYHYDSALSNDPRWVDTFDRNRGWPMEF